MSTARQDHPEHNIYVRYCEHRVDLNTHTEQCPHCAARKSIARAKDFEHIGKSFDLTGPEAPWIRKAHGESNDIDFNPFTTREGVYLVAEVDRPDGRVKIGMTEHGPRERMMGLQQGCPSTLRLVGWIGCRSKSKTARRVESLLHKTFADHRVRLNSEWFYVRGDLAAFMSTPSVLDGVAVCPVEKSRIICSSGRPTR